VEAVEFVSIIEENNIVKNVELVNPYANIKGLKYNVKIAAGVKYVSIIFKDVDVEIVMEHNFVIIISLKYNVKIAAGVKYVSIIYKNKYVKNVMVIKYVSIISKNKDVKNAMVHPYVKLQCVKSWLI
jgi:hypothetical protein